MFITPSHTKRTFLMPIYKSNQREREKKEGKDLADSGFLWVRANFKNEYKGESLKKVFFFLRFCDGSTHLLSHIFMFLIHLNRK